MANSKGTNVIELPIDDAARARVSIRAFAAAYEAAPFVEAARDLVRSVQVWSGQLGVLGLRRSRDAVLEMDAESGQDAMILACANSILRALRAAERRRDARKRASAP